MHFQQTMLQMTQSFISTQQAVMLCYLQSASGYQAAFPLAQASREQFRPTLEPAAPTQPSNSALCDATIEEPLKVFGFNQQGLIGERVSVVSASESLASSSTDVDIATEPVADELDHEQLLASLMDLISERTGYPADMIDPGLDLESDLGIDSIKRIEILNKFQSVLSAERRALLENSLEELASARTVNGIIESILNPTI